MSQLRRRRALHCSVLAATTAVLVSFAVAPPALADPASVAAPSAESPSNPTDSSQTPAPTSSEASAAGPGDMVVGELVQAWPDPAAEDHGDEHAEGHAHEHVDEAPLSWIEPADGDAIRVPTESLPDVGVGSTLAVTVGGEIADEASAEQGFEPAVEVQAAEVLDAAEPDPTTAAAGTAPTNTVTVVLVSPAGYAANSTTVSSVVNMVNGPVSSFWNTQSNGTVRIAAVAGGSGWVTSSQPCTSPSALWNDVAGQVNWTGGAGKHLMLYLPSNATNCAYGLGTVGSSIGSGGRSYVRDVALSVMAHELGHNFGLGHSSEHQCDGALETGSCQTRAYYDFYDVMGISWGQVGSLNAAQAARLGLLPAGEQIALTPSSAPTTVTLAPVSATSGLRAVKLTASDGTVYYVEYRQPSGQDAWLGDSRNAYRLDSGIVVRRAAAGADTSLLLDGSPSTSSRWSSDLQQALPVGTVVGLAHDAFTVAVMSATSTGAVVRVGLPSSTPSIIDSRWADTGGSAGFLGHPTGVEYCGLRSAGCFRTFANGSVYWSPATGAQVVSHGPVAARWASLRWEAGVLGYPVSDTACGLAGGGCFQHFQGGSLYAVGGQPARVVWGAIRDRWVAAGREAGVLGYPLGDEGCGLRGGGCWQVFQGGSVYWSPATGARLVTGVVAARWASLRWEAGVLGYPVSDTACGLAGGGCFQHFQGGSIYASASTGPQPVVGSIRDRWASLGWERSRLGYPVTAEECSAGACTQTFQNGSIRWTPRGGSVVLG